MLVTICKLDNDQTLSSFKEGVHLLGRGALLQCNDKRISRHHATLEIAQNNITLTSMHINPCFFRAANSKTITIVAKDSVQKLNDGDAFSFLPEDFWFRVKIEEVEEEDKVENAVGLKRPSLEEHGTNKKAKIEQADADSTETKIESNDLTVSEVPECSTGNAGQSAIKTETEELKNGIDEEVKEEVRDEDETKELMTLPNVQNDETVKNEESDDRNDSPGTSKPKSRRERCWYQAQCYRKNPVHRKEYSHPGDSDYESDPEDNRPTCSYGAACYRKNKDHRRDYKHPAQRPPPGTKKRTRKKVDNSGADYDLDLSSEDDFERDVTDDEDPDWDASKSLEIDEEDEHEVDEHELEDD